MVTKFYIQSQDNFYVQVVQVAVKNMLVLRWSQRAHCFFCGRPKEHIRAPKGHSAFWKRHSENVDWYMIINRFSCDRAGHCLQSNPKVLITPAI